MILTITNFYLIILLTKNEVFLIISLWYSNWHNYPFEIYASG